MGPDIIDAVLDFFRESKLLKKLNSTDITLIPKIKYPNNVVDFIPISCCNVLYKCITKVLANRSKDVLLYIINENQTGFVHGCFIVHNITLI